MDNRGKLSLVFFLPLSSNTLLHVVAREKARDSVHHSLPPSIVVFLQNIDSLALLKGELIFLVRIVVIDGDHLVQVVLRNPARQGHVLRHHAGSLAVSATGTGDTGLTVLPI